MAIAAAWYGLGLLHIAENSVDLESDTIKMSLHTSTYTPDMDAHNFHDDATNELSAGSGYTAGGVTLTNCALTYDVTSDQVRFDCDDIVYSFSGSKTWKYGVIYKSRGGLASADELIALLTWSADETSSTTYTVSIAATGLLYIDNS